MSMIKSKHPVRALIFLTNPTVILIAVILLLVSQRTPTNVQIELVVGQKIPGTDAASLLQAINSKEIPIKKGSIRYPDYSDIRPVTIISSDSIHLKAEGNLLMQWVRTEGDETRVCIVGVIEKLQTGNNENMQDRRLSLFDKVRTSPQTVWLGIGIWIVATALGWLRVYQVLS